MKNQKQTIRKIVGFLNNVNEEGGFWLPNIQRSFIWSEEQICRLFDSIMREYPISTLLIWKTNFSIHHRKFIENWKNTLRLSDFYRPPDDRKKCLVLDGQQRLQSLFIGLHGSFEGKELCFDILSGEIALPDDIKYKFKFIEPAAITFPMVKFKELVITTKRKREVLNDLKNLAGRELTEAEEDKLNEHIDLVDRTFKMDEAVTYQELDSIDNPNLYTENDVLEVFIRANSGGTKLGKSDLLFSLLRASWARADKKMEDLLESLNKQGFAFGRDFVLKTCLVLLGHGARYEVSKFRREGVREEIEEKWDDIAKAIQDTLDFVRRRTFIQCDKALPSYLVLIPMIYMRYHFPEAWKNAKKMDSYLLRCSLTGVFSGHPDNLIDGLVKKLAELREFQIEEIFGVIRTQNRSLELAEERLWQMGYGSNTIHLLFNLWYHDFNYTPANNINLPQVDHIFPQSALCKIKAVNPNTGRKDLIKYRDVDRNQLANCMLLTGEENGAGEKGDAMPENWFSNKDKDYLGKHLIPSDPSLWKIERFDDFIEERKKLILNKFSYLLVQTDTTKT